MQRKGFFFKDQKIYIGIDVHLKTWSVAIMTESGLIERFSQENDAGVLHSHLIGRYPGGTYYSVYESGFSGYSTHYSLESLGIHNIIVNAADVPSTQKETLHKTDKVDALKLVKGLRRGELIPIYIPSQECLSVRELVRTRDSIVKDLSRWKVRIKHLLYRHGIKYPAEFSSSRSHWSCRFLHWLENEVFTCSGQNRLVLNQHLQMLKLLRSELLSVTRQMRTFSRTEYYSLNMQLLLSIPGVGFLTAMTFLTEMGDISRFCCEKDLASFIGIVPMCHGSGDTLNVGEMTFRGNRQLRSRLIESAWTAIRCDVALAACFGSYCKRMNPNKAIVKIACKLSNRILSVLKKREMYIKGKYE